MPITNTLPLRELELLMQSIPNHEPRYSGRHIYQNMKDKAAGQCIYCADRKDRVGCTHNKCQYTLERFLMGSIGYKELITETYNQLKVTPQMKGRLSNLIKTFDGAVFMNRNHRHRFMLLLQRLRKDDVEQKMFAALYLLTSTNELWKIVEKGVVDDKIFFNKVKLNSMDTDSYVLYQTARSIYDGVTKIRMSEIVDCEITSDEVFKLIIHSSLILIYRVEVLRYIEEGNL